MNYLNPSKILLFSLSSWLIFFTIIPYNYYFNESPNEAIFFCFIMLPCFYRWFFFCNDNISDNEIIDAKNVKSIFYLSFLLGVIGVFFRLYEEFFLILFLHRILTEYRFETINQRDQLSIAGVLGSLFYPFGLVALLIYIYYNKVIFMKKVACLCFWQPIPN